MRRVVFFSLFIFSERVVPNRENILLIVKPAEAFFLIFHIIISNNVLIIPNFEIDKDKRSWKKRVKFISASEVRPIRYIDDQISFSYDFSKRFSSPLVIYIYIYIFIFVFLRLKICDCSTVQVAFCFENSRERQEVPRELYIIYILQCTRPRWVLEASMC